jgi:hypothetical protein
MTPTAANTPTPIRAEIEVAPAAEGLHDEEDETTIFLDRERIASAAWMPLLLVDEHAKLKTKLKTKQSSQPQSTSPTCVSTRMS